MCIDKSGSWLAACIALSVVGAVFVISSDVGVQLAQSSSHGKQGSIPEEISQTLLTNKEAKETWSKFTMPTYTRINREKYTLSVIKSWKPLKTLKKNGSVPYLGAELTIHVIRSQIHLVRQSL